ncbi:hypothetical protein [Marivirga harenae]|uniref:hypothetical protein n=1 Tax=Marivirga harenae TaxID=2010992 RepID=UPI0026DF6223|nr:hypothetical protein [Marivirga harenae]WKV13946.1 hypothetical protein Q3Y49_08905 [Marivirga harenae]
MYKFLLPLCLLIVSCKDLNDFEPYFNKNAGNPQILSMDPIGLGEGADFGGCFLAADFIKLYETALNQNVSLQNMEYEILIDGFFYSGGSVNYYNRELDCITNISGQFVGMHEVTIGLWENEEAWNGNENVLASFFGYREYSTYFQQDLNFAERGLGDVEIRNQSLQNGVLTLSFAVIGGEAPSVFKFSNRFGSNKEWESYYFGKTDIISLEWDAERSRIFEMEYSNRHQTKSVTVYLQ